VDWFTSDTHFGHYNVIEYAKRPFRGVEEMDDELVARWNEVVRQTDTVYHLGDFTLRGKSAVLEYAARLNGHIKLVPGGHDRWTAKFSGNEKISVLPPLVTLEYPQLNEFPLVIVLCHYPLKSWDRSHYGSLHLHGHHHVSMKEEHNSLNVGVDLQGFCPVSLDEIKEYFIRYEV